MFMKFTQLADLEKKMFLISLIAFSKWKLQWNQKVIYMTGSEPTNRKQLIKCP